MLPSVYVPVAVNCCDVPKGMDDGNGVTAIETRTGGVTVSVAERLIVPDVAVMVVAPCPRVLARPCATLATFASEELQVAVFVRSEVLPSL